MTDAHLSRLAGWLVHTVGRALLGGMLTALALALALILVGDGDAALLAIILGPLVTALMLWAAVPPSPEVEDDRPPGLDTPPPLG